MPPPLNNINNNNSSSHNNNGKNDFFNQPAFPEPTSSNSKYLNYRNDPENLDALDNPQVEDTETADEVVTNKCKVDVCVYAWNARDFMLTRNACVHVFVYILNVEDMIATQYLCKAYIQGYSMVLMSTCEY